MYNNIFHLKGDPHQYCLMHINIVAHEIHTQVDSATVNVKSYQIPEKHKKEVHKQIRKCLTK